MSQPQQSQPEWNPQHQRYFVTQWSEQWQQSYWTHYDGQNWVFFDWIPQTQATSQAPGINRPVYQTHSRTDSFQTLPTTTQDERQDDVIKGTQKAVKVQPDLYSGPLDPSFCVRPSSFFEEGRVFAILFSEPASGNTDPTRWYNSGNTNLSLVQYGEYVFTHVRRFIVVKRRREFCYAVPIFTYGGKGTAKRGVSPDEHAIVYSHGFVPQLVNGEAPLSKTPICVVMTGDSHALSPASRVYFAIHHPIQYNVKVKDVGHVHPDHLHLLLSYWKSMNDDSPYLTPSIASNTPALTIESDFEEVRNPHNFFKVARVFTTPWTEPDGSSGKPFTKTARFVVVKPGPTFSVCLRISTYAGQATTKFGVVAHQHAAVIPQGGQVVLHQLGEHLSKEPIEIKIENPDVDIKPMSRINFAKPYTVEHNVKIRNVGRVVGDSVKRLEKYFAESLGFTKPTSEST